MFSQFPNISMVVEGEQEKGAERVIVGCVLKSTIKSSKNICFISVLLLFLVFIVVVVVVVVVVVAAANWFFRRVLFFFI
jgi:hypothetical protein